MPRLTNFETEHKALEFIKNVPPVVHDFIIKAFEKEGYDLKDFDDATIVLNTLRLQAYVYLNARGHSKGIHVCNFSMNFETSTFMYGTFPYQL